MTIKLVRIGNSRGIRLPKAVIEQAGLGDKIELEVKRDHLVVRPAKSPRAGWEAAFRRMRARGDDKLLDEASVSKPSEWDLTEWTW